MIKLFGAWFLRKYKDVQPVISAEGLAAIWLIRGQALIESAIHTQFAS